MKCLLYLIQLVSLGGLGTLPAFLLGHTQLAWILLAVIAGFAFLLYFTEISSVIESSSPLVEEMKCVVCERLAKVHLFSLGSLLIPGLVLLWKGPADTNVFVLSALALLPPIITFMYAMCHTEETP